MNNKRMAAIVTIIGMISVVGTVTILTPTDLIRQASPQLSCEDGYEREGTRVHKCNVDGTECIYVFPPVGSSKVKCH